MRLTRCSLASRTVLQSLNGTITSPENGFTVVAGGGGIIPIDSLVVAYDTKEATRRVKYV